MIADGVTGFLVAPDDIRGAAEAVRRAAEISRPACRAHAERHLDLERSLDAHEQLYGRVAAPCRQQPAADPGHWLAGRVAVVTGASRGIGAATAEAIAAAGAHVVLAARDREALAGVAGRIRDAGGEATPVPADVSQVQDVERLFAAAARGGPLSRAGLRGRRADVGAVRRNDAEIWEETLRVNLTGLIPLLPRRVHRHAPGRRRTDRQHRLAVGRLRHREVPGLAAYNVSKYGVIGLTEATRARSRRSASRWPAAAPRRRRRGCPSSTSSAVTRKLDHSSARSSYIAEATAWGAGRISGSAPPRSTYSSQAPISAASRSAARHWRSHARQRALAPPVHPLTPSADSTRSRSATTAGSARRRGRGSPTSIDATTRPGRPATARPRGRRAGPPPRHRG